MSYEKYHPSGWQSGESGGTPITPEALEHIENGIQTAYESFAPAGYGLGASPKKAEDCDDARINGWYYIDSATANRPEHIQYGVLFPQYRTSQGMVQECADVYGLVARRCKQNGVWGPWEYLNPPMVLGVEYRTTERWNGKVVYTKLVDIGSLPNNTKKEVSGAVTEGFSRFLDIKLHIKGTGTVYEHRNSHANVDVYGFGDGTYGWLVVTTKSDMSAYTAYATIKYTKD